MKKYDSYKDSGIEWIGKIPEGWNVVPMKHYFYMKGRIGWQGLKADEFLDEGPYLVTGTDFENGKVCWDRCYHISEERYNEAPEIHVASGDLLITKDGTVGKLALIEEKPEKVSLNSHLLILRPTKENINNKFVYWALQSVNFKDYTGLASSGSTMASLSQEKIGAYHLILPAPSEQQAIATYLDHKVGQIDASISAITDQIEDLKAYRQSVISEAVTKGLDPDAKMKDSGIEWIGEIPEGWDCTRLRFLVKKALQYGASESGDSEHPEYPRYIRITDITDEGKLKDEGAKYLEPVLAAPYMLERGDILFARSGATVGKTYLFNEEISACFAGYLIKASCNDRLLPDFLFYYTQSGVYENWKDSMFTQATIQNIGADKYNELNVPVPSRTEQQAIATYLDQKTTEIDSAIKALEEQMADLKALKQSVISEAVTGKIDVRDWTPNC